jgi:tRNA-Thr(GGU) m(6)t(6)A37 methyltransferase TsaA
MNSPSVTFRPIGVLHTPHTELKATPIQPVYADDCPGRAELLPELADGLADLEGFSHVYLLYWLHRASPAVMRVQPYLQDIERGLFATRFPARPNPIGLSLVRLLRCEGSVLHFNGADMLDGTPLLDIKPYAPRYDVLDQPRGGWTEDVDEATAQQRGRRQWNADAAGAPPPHVLSSQQPTKRKQES